MNSLNRVVCAVIAVSSLVVFAERPPARHHAKPELLQGTDGLTPGARFLATLSPSAREELRRKGQVVLDQSANGKDNLIRAVVRFERPRDQVFAVITQPARQREYLPHVTQSSSVGRSAEGESVDMVVSFLFTFRYRTQHWFYPEESRMEWNLDPSGEKGLKEQVGFWQLYELDEKTTIGEYGTHVASDSDFLNFLRGLGERGGIADALGSMRKYVHVNTH